MIEDEAAQVIQTLKGLLPGTTPEQLFFLKREFMKFDSSIVEAAIDAHAKIYPQVNIPRLLEQIRDASPGRAIASARSLAEKKKVEDEHKRVEAALSRLSADELQQCALLAIEDAAPSARSFLKKSDPHRSAVLRSLIYQHLCKSIDLAGKA